MFMMNEAGLLFVITQLRADRDARGVFLEQIMVLARGARDTRAEG